MLIVKLCKMQKQYIIDWYISAVSRPQNRFEPSEPQSPQSSQPSEPQSLSPQSRSQDGSRPKYINILYLFCIFHSYTMSKILFYHVIIYTIMLKYTIAHLKYLVFVYL